MQHEQSADAYILSTSELEAIGEDDAGLNIFNKSSLLRKITISRMTLEAIDPEVNDSQMCTRLWLSFVATRHGWLGKLEDMECQLKGEELDSGIAEAAQQYINTLNDSQ